MKIQKMTVRKYLVDVFTASLLVEFWSSNGIKKNKRRRKRKKIKWEFGRNGCLLKAYWYSLFQHVETPKFVVFYLFQGFPFSTFAIRKIN